MDAARMIIFKEDTILLLRSVRSLDPDDIGKWEVPGGYLKHDEEPRDAALRQTKEEARLDCKILFELHPFVRGTEHTTHVFAGVVMDGTVKLSDEHDEYEWVEINKLRFFPQVLFHEKLLEYVSEARQMMYHVKLDGVL